MPSNEAKCIYHAESPDCTQSFDPTKGEGDHIIPAALGEFEGDERLRAVCPSCNNRIGQCEQQLLQCGPEAFLRRLVKPRSKRLRRRGTGKVKAAAGTPAPQFTIDAGGHSELVEPSPDDPRNVFPVDQLVIRDEKDSEHTIRLFPGMRADQLRDRIRGKVSGEVKDAHLHCDDGRWDQYLSLLKQIWPELRIEELAPTEPGVHRVPGRIKFIVNDAYFRAIAKIGFHYYLVHSKRDLNGDEPGFSRIRDFIINGGNFEEFFDKSKARFVLPFRHPWHPSHYCHVLAADESEETAIAYVHLFIGPGIDHPPYYVTLGPVGSKVVVPGFVQAHFYIYDQPNSSGRYAGPVVRATVTQFRPY